MSKWQLLIVLATAVAFVGRAAADSKRHAPVKPDQSALVEGNTAFALDLYARLRSQKGNLFFSPYSISAALGMTYAGARGTTAKQMAKVLHFPQDTKTLHRGFAALQQQLQGKHKGYELRIANALWGQKGYGFQEAYLHQLQADYGGGLYQLDFGSDPEAARKTINAWVEKQTKRKIQDLIQKDLIDDRTRFVLTNAIYFKRDWAGKFDKRQTKKELFKFAGGDKVLVPMMHQSQDLRYLDAGTFQALELPYAGRDLAMVVFLPKKVDGLAAFEESLTPGKLSTWLSKLHKEEGALVTMPKFKMTSAFNLHEVLPTMGMRLAFTAGQADFSGINGEKTLFLTFAVHKAFVDVNEEGTEATAATAIGGGEQEAHEPVEFKADHPFLFLIRDNRSQSILFMGRLRNPVK
jgi:serpin B